MNVKQIIQKELDDLVLAIAELYTPLISEDSSDEEFEVVAESVTVERDQAIDNLVTLAEVIIEDTLEEVKATELKKGARLRKLVPADISLREAPASVPEAPVAPPVMERVDSVPREVTEGITPLELPQDFAEAANRIQQGGRADLAINEDMDMADNADYTHNIGLTLAEQKRRDIGLPIKLHRPSLHFGKPEKVTPPTPPVPEVAEKTNFTLEEIEEEARGK
jgi:hypothetical protein